MTAAIPIAKTGSKASETAYKALTGDLYVSRWQTIKGKGKNKKAIDHELHINPMTLAIGAAAAGAAALAVGIGMWVTQRKLTVAIPDGGAKRWWLIRAYPAKTEPVTISDPGTGHWVYADGTIGWGSDYKGGAGGWAPGATWVQDTPPYEYTLQKVTQRGRTVVTTLKGFPVRTFLGGTDPSTIEKDTTQIAESALTQRERAQGWALDAIESSEQRSDQLGNYLFIRARFKNLGKNKIGTGDREGFKIGGGILG